MRYLHSYHRFQLHQLRAANIPAPGETVRVLIHQLYLLPAGRDGERIAKIASRLSDDLPLQRRYLFPRPEIAIAHGTEAEYCMRYKPLVFHQAAQDV